MSKVLVIIKSRGIGDLCILSRYIQEISKYNSHKVTVLAQENTKAKEILKYDPHVEEVIELDEKGFFKTLKKIKSKKFNKSYILSDSIRLYLISKFSNIKHIFHYKSLLDGYKMVGNAVPVNLATHLALQIFKDLT